MYDTNSPLRKIFFVAPKLLFIAGCVILSILFAQLVNMDPTFDNTITRALAGAFDNFHQMPLTQIATAQSDGTCPTGYTLTTLGDWDGTSPGCYCSASTTLHNGTCTSKDSGCTDVAAVGGFPLTRWLDNSFCVQRMTSFEYTNKSGACSDGLTLCAGNLCVNPTLSDCPITDIQILPSGSAVTETYTSIDLANDRILIYTSAKVDEPIVSILISFYDYACMDPLFWPFPKDKKSFPLSVFPESGCAAGGTNDYGLNVETSTVTDVMNENGITALVTNGRVPLYESYMVNETAYFVADRQYTLRLPLDQCGALQSSIFPEMRSFEKPFLDKIYTISIAGFAVLGVLFITIIVEIAFRIRNNEEETHILKYVTYFNLFMLFSACSLFIVMGAFAAHTKVQLSSDNKYLKRLSKINCFAQGDVNTLLYDLQWNVSNFYVVMWLSIVLLILGASGIISAIILVFLDSFITKKSPGFGAASRTYGKRQNRKPKLVGNVEMLMRNNEV